MSALSAKTPVVRYLSWLDTLVKFVFSLVPIVFTAAIIATEIPAAIRPYSISVAPESSVQKRSSICNIAALPGLPPFPA